MTKPFLKIVLIYLERYYVGRFAHRHALHVVHDKQHKLSHLHQLFGVNHLIPDQKSPPHKHQDNWPIALKPRKKKHDIKTIRGQKSTGENRPIL